MSPNLPKLFDWSTRYIHSQSDRFAYYSPPHQDLNDGMRRAALAITHQGLLHWEAFPPHWEMSVREAVHVENP